MNDSWWFCPHWTCHIIHHLAVQLVASLLSMWKPGFDPCPVHVRFVLTKWYWNIFFYEYFSLPLSMTYHQFSTFICSPTCQWCYIILATNGIICIFNVLSLHQITDFRPLQLMVSPFLSLPPVLIPVTAQCHYLNNSLNSILKTMLFFLGQTLSQSL